MGLSHGQNSDLRLGDVVVSKPSGTHGGVIQYDIGKATAGGWDRKDCLGLPPQVLLNAVTHIEAEHIIDDSRISEFLQDLPPKVTQSIDGYVYQGSENDRLFKSSSYHQPGDDCSVCETAERGFSARSALMMSHKSIKELLDQATSLLKTRKEGIKSWLMSQRISFAWKWKRRD